MMEEVIYIGDGENEKLGLEEAKGIYPLQAFPFACEKKLSMICLSI